MTKTVCTCGHEKRDHVIPLMGTQGYGECKVCLCARYEKEVIGVPAAAMTVAGD